MKFNIVYIVKNNKNERYFPKYDYFVFENKTLQESIKIIKKYENDENYKFVRMIERQEN